MKEQDVMRRIRRAVRMQGADSDETLKRAAEAVGVPADQLAECIEARTDMPLGVFVRLCDALGVSCSAMFGDQSGGRQPIRTASRVPTLMDADAYGSVLIWQPRCGWTTADWRVVANSLKNGLIVAYPYWMPLPDSPMRNGDACGSEIYTGGENG